MIVVIGSRALNYYLPINRKMHDWDFIMNETDYNYWFDLYSKYKVKETSYSIIYEIGKEMIEIRNPRFLDKTDKELLEKCYLDSPAALITPFGLNACVPIMQTLYDIKKATVACIEEPKHKHDLELIEKHYSLEKNTSFFQLRLKETQERITKSQKVKYDFFHKYHIPEYVLHDRIHEMFADLLDLIIPTYQRITTAETDISEDLFNKLTHDQKISLMVEEVLVLNMERWFIPQMVENGINYRLIDKFYNNNEAMPTYLILKHVCLTGLKGEAKYITDFSKASFFEIEQKWIEAKEKILSKRGFPKWFFEEIFTLRAKYRKGEFKGIV